MFLELAIAAAIHVVAPGDTLWSIGQAHGETWQTVWSDNRWIKDPDLIYPGWRVKIPAGHAGPPARDDGDADGDDSLSISHQITRESSSPANFRAGVYSYTGLEVLWEAAGGASWAAPHAACIAEHESSGVSWATGPVGERGLWQINPAAWPPSLATYDPLGNARAAVLISHDGSNWSAWATAGMCLLRARTEVLNLGRLLGVRVRPVERVRRVRVRVAAMLALYDYITLIHVPEVDAKPNP